MRVKELIGFCGLTWEDKLFSSSIKIRSPIKTMSTAQARQPIYKSSMKFTQKIFFFS